MSVLLPSQPVARRDALFASRTSEQIQIEIQAAFGFVPSFFAPVEQNPNLLDHLWQQTLSAYVKNPLPDRFKEKLSAYLSRFCAAPYCLLCHSCSLYGLGVKPQEILALLQTAPPDKAKTGWHLQRLIARSDDLRDLSNLEADLETSLLQCAIFVAMQAEQAEQCLDELRRLLGVVNYQFLVAFIAYVKTCHTWVLAHPEISYQTDRRVQAHFQAMTAASPELAKFFATYGEQVQQQRQMWAERQAAIAEDALRASEARFYLIAQATNDAIWEWDLQTDTVWWNEGAHTLFGYTAVEVEPKVAWWYEHIHANDRSRVTSSIQAVLESQESTWSAEYRYRRADGTYACVSDRGYIIRDETGKPLRMIGGMTDLTEKKQLEAQLLRAQRLESIGTLAGGIAHDLNNVLTPILASAQLLLMQPTTQATQQRLLETIQNSARRGAALLKQVLSFARGMEGQCTILQARHLISEIRQIAQETFPKSIEVRLNLPNDLWLVSGDATQLHQVLMNLCVNARDAMPQGGVLRLSAANVWIDEQYARMNLEAQVGPYIQMTIADTGMGIPPEIVDRIFEPFFTTKELGKGTGLGLSTVLGIVRSHGGFVEVSSSLGEGTQFKIYLPAVEAEEPLQAPESELDPGHGELILVVDDEASIREVNQDSLEAYHYRVLTAIDGIDAIALYAEHKHEISAVLIDLMMPSMDGAIAIRAIKKINPQVKIVAISGLMFNSQVTENIQSEVHAFLPKPYTAKELVTTLRAVLQTD